jgi:hypothetical protein
MLWDAAACEELLTQRYPWFMPTWRALGNSTVLKSGGAPSKTCHKHCRVQICGYVSSVLLSCLLFSFLVLLLLLLLVWREYKV